MALLLLAAPPAIGREVRVGELWRNNCISCHGENGAGGSATSLLDDQWTVGGADRELFDSIHDGLPDWGMDAYGETMSGEEVWALVAYIHELRERHRRANTPPPHETANAAGVIESMHHRYRIEEYIPESVGLRIPWSIEWLPDGGVMVADRPGTLWLFPQGPQGPRRKVTGVPEVLARGQGGLLDVAVHPDYTDPGNGWVYLSYSDPIGSGRESRGLTRVVRGRINDAGRFTDEQLILEFDEDFYTRSNLHYGCRLVFTPPVGSGPDPGRRYLYVCIGERGQGELAQRPDRPNGKVFRVRDDGSIPEDNPLLERDDALPAVFSYGHRNPQGMVMDMHGRLWVTEHGPRGGDELNLIRPGRNYGWDEVSYGIHYNGRAFRLPWHEPTRFEPPVLRWNPSIAVCGLATIGKPAGFEGPDQALAFPRWRGDLFAGGLAGQVVERLRIGTGPGPDGFGEGHEPAVVEREEIIRGMGRVRDVATGPDGYLYVVLNGPDRVVRVTPAD